MFVWLLKKSLSEYLNVKDQDQLELYVRMKNVATLWANDILVTGRRRALKSCILR